MWSPGGYELYLQQAVFQIISASFCREVLVSEFIVFCFIVLLFQANMLNQKGLLPALCKGALKHNSWFFFNFSFCDSGHWDFGVSRQIDSSCPNHSSLEAQL